MKRQILLVLLCLFIGVGCAKSCNKNNDLPTNAKDTAAVVNGKTVSLSKLDEAHQRAMGQMQRTGQDLGIDKERKLRSNILIRLIDDEILSQHAEKLGIQITDADREVALQNYKTRIGGQKGYDAMINQGGMTEVQILENLASDLVRTKILDKEQGKLDISDEDIKGYYEANKKQFAMPESVHVRHILFRVNPSDPPAKLEEVKKKAQGVLEEAKKPGANFEDLAVKYSEGPSKEKKGDLGFVGRGRMVKEFEDAAFNAPIKTPVGPVQTGYGFHLVYVDEKKAPHTAAVEEVRDRIVDSLTRNKQARKGETILEELRKNARIKILDYSITDQEYVDFWKDQLAKKEE